MTHHITEHELIDFQFKLCSHRDAEKIAQHIEACPECRRQAEILRATFAQLGAVKEDVVASEQLIADTLRKTRLAEPAPATSAIWPRLAWFIGTAATAALALLIVVDRDLRARSVTVQADDARRSASTMELASARNKKMADEKKPAELAQSVSAPRDQEELAAAAPAAALAFNEPRQKPVARTIAMAMADKDDAEPTQIHVPADANDWSWEAGHVRIAAIAESDSLGGRLESFAPAKAAPSIRPVNWVVTITNGSPAEISLRLPRWVDERQEVTSKDVTWRRSGPGQVEFTLVVPPNSATSFSYAVQNRP